MKCPLRAMFGDVFRCTCNVVTPLSVIPKFLLMNESWALNIGRFSCLFTGPGLHNESKEGKILSHQNHLQTVPIASDCIAGLVV